MHSVAFSSDIHFRRFEGQSLRYRRRSHLAGPARQADRGGGPVAPSGLLCVCSLGDAQWHVQTFSLSSYAIIVYIQPLGKRPLVCFEVWMSEWLCDRWSDVLRGLEADQLTPRVQVGLRRGYAALHYGPVVGKECIQRWNLKGCDRRVWTLNLWLINWQSIMLLAEVIHLCKSSCLLDQL